jgi:hypothetical protein
MPATAKSGQSIKAHGGASMTKIITLTQGQVAKVSDEWYEELSKYKWLAHYAPGTNSFYAERQSSRLLGKQKLIKMHRVIMNAPEEMAVDHIDHDTLNNQVENLRLCTTAQNMCNQGKQKNNTSGFKGVTKRKNRWEAGIRLGSLGKTYIGRYSTPEEAAHAYDEAAKKYHGEFAELNFPG